MNVFSRHIKSLHRFSAGFLALILLGAAACGGSPEASSDEAGPVALVEAVRVRQDTLTQRIPVYGKVISSPGGAQTFSAPFESRIRQVLVRPGEAVERGAPLVRLAPSPDAQKQIEQAQAALDAAREQLKSIQERYDLHLATRDEVAQQQQAYQDAQARYARVKSWQQYGRIAAPASGVVTRVLAEEGALAPAGDALVRLALKNRFEVRLGVESEKARLVEVGARVHVEPVGRQPGGRGLLGTVRGITGQVDSLTHLVDVIVALPDRSNRLLLGQFVRGRIAIASAPGLVVPRAVLLPAHGQYALFTIHRGRASRHPATLAGTRDSLALIVSAGVEPGDSVAVLGNYELQEDMRVRTQPSPSGASRSGGATAERPSSSSDETRSGSL